MVKLAKEPAKLAKRQPHPLAPKGGRPQVIKATPELVARVCAKIEQGLPIESSLVLEGISRQALDKWRNKNPLIEIQFQRAEALFEERMVGKVEKHADKDVKAATWLLERRSRGQWLPAPTKTELTGKDGGPIQALTLSKVLLSSVAQAVDAPKPMKQAIPA